MKELFERLEALEAPCRKVDYAIFQTIAPLNTRTFWEPDSYLNHYTCSMDAALTLVPEGWKWQISCGEGDAFLSCLWFDKTGIDDIFDRGNTAAIALCIASLKAREARA